MLIDEDGADKANHRRAIREDAGDAAAAADLLVGPFARVLGPTRPAASAHTPGTRFTESWLAEHPRDAAIVADLKVRARAPKSEQQVRGELMQLETRAHHDVWDRLDRISCPTLVACGETDGQAPKANSEALHSRISTSELRVYDGGHLFIWQDRSALPEIMDFLAGG